MVKLPKTVATLTKMSVTAETVLEAPRVLAKVQPSAVGDLRNGKTRPDVYGQGKGGYEKDSSPNTKGSAKAVSSQEVLQEQGNYYTTDTSPSLSQSQLTHAKAKKPIH
ncbi:hypothetical protein PtrV1_10271 [Pyrenophora tritici-repentis]|uniref:Uncharacterized protein n=1 Tax=Pyrenophora tritici-repentis TaxID=45151 RepID=A0A5M9KZ81_9PLEO|nr:hypothetical protein PtrV1_10271 [Pyrenophora tritici-repentis]KAI1515418.1 hypothetical protein Ptr86124_005419 [Pyrenophora tritici-repentis]